MTYKNQQKLIVLVTELHFQKKDQGLNLEQNNY